jgi:hypothetical protein
MIRSTRRAGSVLLAATVALSGFVSIASASKPEFEGPFPSKFSYTGAGTTLSNAGFTGSCTNAKGAGSFTSAKTGTIQITFKGCTLGQGTSCNTKGAARGEIISGTLPIALGYLKWEPTKEVGLEVNHGTALFAEFTCGSSSTEGGMRGAILGPLSPLNTSTTTFALGSTNKTKFNESLESMVLEINWLGTVWLTGTAVTSGSLTFEHATQLKA